MTVEGPGAGTGLSAGALLRAAREKQGLHIAALAAAIKVTPRKLEALEADRYEELSGVIFTRALAQSVCRVLRIDAKPVLALLPRPASQPLEVVPGDLNAPFRQRGAQDDWPMGLWLQRAALIGAVLLMAGAAALFLLPFPNWGTGAKSVAAPASAVLFPPTPANAQAAASAVPIEAVAGGASAALALDAPSQAASGVATDGGATPLVPGAAALPPTASNPAAPSAAAPTSTAAPGAEPLVIETAAPSWVEVRDGSGRLLVSRQLLAQERLALDGQFPLSVVVGNAAVTQLTLRGRPVDLSSATRGAVARIELP